MVLDVKVVVSPAKEVPDLESEADDPDEDTHDDIPGPVGEVLGVEFSVTDHHVTGDRNRRQTDERTEAGGQTHGSDDLTEPESGREKLLTSNGT